MKNKLLSLSFLSLLILPVLTGCGEGKVTNLRILNMEDYIYLYSQGDEDTFDDLNQYDEKHRNLIDIFAYEMSEKYPEMGKINVLYTTTDTNESLYNELITGKAFYDVICPSDYMIQRLICDDLIEKLDKTLIPNYFDFSTFDEDNHLFSDNLIKNKLGTLTSVNMTIPEKDRKTEYLVDYSIGYMWGTLGILYNPNFANFDATIFDDVCDWDMLWNEKYNKTISIKNSLRDTYAIGIIKTFKEKLSKALLMDFPCTIDGELYQNYSEYICYIMNMFDQDTIDLVKENLVKLKNNSFGLEVDSGKTDIVNGKIGVNLAWSGDACYAMEQAYEVDEELYYAVPYTGSNIWFDGWVIPKRDNRSEDERILAHEFLNFISRDDVVAKNVYYTGYTPFTQGDATIEQVRDFYDARTDFIYYYDELNDQYFSVFYISKDEDGNDVENIIYYEDFEPNPVGEYGLCHNHEFDSYPLYYYDINDEMQPYPNPYEEEISYMKYGDISLELFTDTYSDFVQTIELSYFFGSNPYNHTFYSSMYLPFIDEGNVYTGLEFYCFLPDEDTVNRCATMYYDHVNNDRLVKMWEDFKSEPLPIWALVTLITIVSLLVFLFASFYIATRTKIKLRKKRNAETK